VGKTLVGIMAGAALAAAAAAPVRAAGVVVYDGLSADPVGFFARSNSENPAYGGALMLAQPGTLTVLGLTLYNGDGGSILAGTLDIYFFDNTIPYAGGTLDHLPLLGQGQIDLDWTQTELGALPAYNGMREYIDFTGSGIHLPQNILVVQQFTLTAGDSVANGVAVMPDPPGTSPPTVFLSSDVIAPGLYIFGDAPYSQFGYSIEVEPDPAPTQPVPLPAAGLSGMALLGVMAAFKLRKTAGA